MGEKLISKNHLTAATDYLLLGVTLENRKNRGMILEKFKSGSRPGIW
jgi:hypothetical protein